ncbi:MAG: hypothetical protein JWO94_2053 [Verrucomicrobiaceae bacterium]|nr:hypothetical protein [Verrucomicrobiaceae bacterium]
MTARIAEPARTTWMIWRTSPSRGRVTQWTGGLGVALFFHHLRLAGPAQHATLIGRNGSIELGGDAATALACAYVALGAFCHFHWFWGLHARLWEHAQTLKTLALLVFLPCFLFTLYRILWV